MSIKESNIAKAARASWFSILIAAVLISFGPVCHAQQDTSVSSFVLQAQERANENARINQQKYREGHVAIKQDEIIEEVLKVCSRAKQSLKYGIDTAAINGQIKSLNDRYDILSDGVFINRGAVQTFRNLSTSSAILVQLLHEAKGRRDALSKYYRDLADYKDQIDSLTSLSILYELPSDSVKLVRHQQKVRIVLMEIAPIDSAMSIALAMSREELISISRVVNRFRAGLEEIESYQREISNRTLKREFSNLWGAPGFVRPFSEILQFSIVKGKLALKYYLRNHLGKIIFLLLLIAMSTLFLRSLKHKLAEESLYREEASGQLILRYPMLASVFIVLNIFQFIFPSPPFLFNGFIWTFSAICLTIIFRNSITRYWMLSWLALVVLFVLACANNAILQASRVERWLMLVLGAASVLTCCVVLLKGHRDELRKKGVVYFIILAVLLAGVSIIGNLYGRYNFPKALLTSSIYGVMIAVMFLWTASLINEALLLASSVYKSQDRRSFYINFNRIGRKVPPVFYALMILGWFILVARNFHSYKLLTEPLSDFIFNERSIGNFTYSIESVLIFIIIIYLSAVISRIISFFASNEFSKDKQRKSGVKGPLSRWLLIIRIAILSLGLLLAFAASGVPMDKVSIIIGALGVGIGFGLQTLVNNLVSGLIISFENPVNVGDIVEIAGKSGTMKSIGFRSSIITTWDGADVIVPNGDLLDQHLVNWTLGNKTRRVEVIVGVAYGTDLEHAKQLIMDLLSTDERIKKDPAPNVLAVEFNSSSVDLKVLFWVHDIGDWMSIRSDVISRIDVVFKENGIVIPFPQRDVRILSSAEDKDAPAPKSNDKEGNGND